MTSTTDASHPEKRGSAAIVRVASSRTQAATSAFRSRRGTESRSSRV
jgi:hypothetical protein